jgi:hypothetical protein
MIDLDWLNDERTADPADYLIPWNALKSRRRAFLAGWTWYLEEGAHRDDRVAWYAVGAFYASILGDIPEEQRRELYYGALAQFVTSERCREWSDEERQDALRLAREALTP